MRLSRRCLHSPDEYLSEGAAALFKRSAASCAALRERSGNDSGVRAQWSRMRILPALSGRDCMPLNSPWRGRRLSFGLWRLERPVFSARPQRCAVSYSRRFRSETRDSPSALSGLIRSADALLSALRGVPLRRPKQGLLYAVFRIARRAARRRNTDVQIGIRVQFCREDSRPVFRKPTDSPPSCASRRRGAHCLFSAGRRSFAISSVLRAAS